MMRVNALSIDLEFWWCNEFLTDYLPCDREDGFRDSLRPIFAVLDAFDVKATFFVLGAVAEQYPEVVSEIYRDGHEIACHSYSHRPLYTMNRDEFEDELEKSLELLADYNPIGFRAPSFSLNNRTKWAINLLEKHGFQYDSSIFPAKAWLYGVPGAPVGIYRPSRDDISIHDPDGPIVEFPLSVLRLGMNIPVSAGSISAPCRSDFSPGALTGLPQEAGQHLRSSPRYLPRTTLAEGAVHLTPHYLPRCPDVA